MSTLISQLPEEIRKKAISNRQAHDKASINNVLGTAFAWVNTPEGYDYWEFVDTNGHDNDSVRQQLESIYDRRLSRNETIDLLVKLWEETK